MEQLKETIDGLDRRICRAMEQMGFTKLTPIQEKAIPVLMEGKDIIGQAQTGTGKTAAFGVPLLQRIDKEDRNLQAIVLCPTRELAVQCAGELRKLAAYMDGIKVLPVYGGQDISRQISALKQVQIVVGTPGRVIDHMRRHTMKMKTVKMVVLDEADEMLNMGFCEDIETILSEIPKEHQTALFSATMPQAILDITEKYQNDAVRIRTEKMQTTASLVSQYCCIVKKEDKQEALCHLLSYYNPSLALVFCNTRRMVDEIVEQLRGRGYAAEGIHGDMRQGQRDIVMKRFRGRQVKVLVASDVAARGIDVDDIEMVFNYDVPQDDEYYIHRIGRTGRAGKSGTAFTLASRRDLRRLRELEEHLHVKLTEKEVPSVSDILNVKVKRAAKKAVRISQKENLDSIAAMLEEVIRNDSIDPLVLAAALMQMETGNIRDAYREVECQDRYLHAGERRNRRRRRGETGGKDSAGSGECTSRRSPESRRGRAARERADRKENAGRRGRIVRPEDRRKGKR